MKFPSKEVGKYKNNAKNRRQEIVRLSGAAARTGDFNEKANNKVYMEKVVGIYKILDHPQTAKRQ